MLRINIPLVTRLLLAIIIALSFLYNVARWSQLTRREGSDYPEHGPIAPYLALIPRVSLLYPWTILTATFVEQNVVTLLVNGSMIFFGGKYLERAWGSYNFTTVVLISTIVPNLLMIPTYLVWAAVAGTASRGQTSITGGVSLQATFLVAFKQLVPEHTVSIYKGLLKIRVKHFPAIFLLANTTSGLLFGTDTALFLAWYGLLTSWIYLRFYMRQPNISGTTTGGEGIRGDASETFAFATFFPDVVQPPIAAICNQIFIFLCNMKLCTPFSDEAIATGNEQVAARSENGLPNIASQGRGVLRAMNKRDEAERRRTLALQALDQRLNASRSRVSDPVVISAPRTNSEADSVGGTDNKSDV